MKPVVVNPAISFTQLVQRTGAASPTTTSARLVRDQFLAKLQRKKRHLSESARTATSRPRRHAARRVHPQAARRCRWPTSPPGSRRTPTSARSWIARATAPRAPIFVSDHDDRLLGVERGYGKATKPEDYLKDFADFIKSRRQHHPRA